MSPIRGLLRPDAAEILSELEESVGKASGIRLARMVRLANLLARYAELDQILMGRGVGGTTVAKRGSRGTVEAVSELPQAKEYRWLHGAILELEAAVGRGKEASLWGA